MDSSESSLRTLDVVGLLMGVLMLLGPLATPFYTAIH